MERVTGIEPALSAWESVPSGPVTCPDLRFGVPASDRERPLVTGVNGPLMAQAGKRGSPVRGSRASCCRSSRGLLYVYLVDATLAWTVVGSAAGVVGVGFTVAATVLQPRLGRTARPEVTAELAHGLLGEDGVLCVEFASGGTNVIMVPKPGKTKTSADRKPRKKARSNLESKPVNAIFIRNHGQTPVTLSHCHYVSDLNGVGFRFEPQPAASPRGDHLPKRLEPGEDALLIHEFIAMPIFLNQVLRDHGVDIAVFEVVLTLGHGVEVVASPPVRVQADMSEEEIAAAGIKLERQEIDLRSSSARPINSGRRRFRKTHDRWGFVR
jgi:hypothetical protein